MRSIVLQGWLACCLVAVAAGSSWAQQTSPAAEAQAAQSPASAEAPRPGELNAQASRVYIFVDKKGLGHQHAVEGKLKSGSLCLGAKESVGQLVFDMRSFDADTETARRYLGLEGTTDSSTRAKVNENMKGSHVLDVAHFPTATFDVVSAVPTGRATNEGLPYYELSGTFTLHGTPQSVKVLAAAEQSRGWLHLRGNFGIKQTSYGMTPYSAAFGAIGVADPLVIYGDLWIAPTESVAALGIPERK
jgi:polyisoprenoid-binding protein YceI